MELNKHQRGLTSCFVITVLLITVDTQATPISTTREQNSQIEASTLKPLEQKQQAAQWGLTEEEWSRYQTLMQGQRGILSPGLDPLTALGVEARSDAERQRYAELQAQFEFERVTRELAYQRAYDEAAARLAEGTNRVTPFLLKPQGATRPLLQGLSSPIRYDVIVALKSCERCDQTVKDLVAKGVAMNLWVTDSNKDDKKIRTWANRLKIPAEKVRSGLITLNHGDKMAMDTASLPVIRRRQ